MFCATVMCGNNALSWNTVLTSRKYGGTPVTSLPPSSIRPASGRSKPAISRSKVVFPDPDGPSKVKNSPAAMVSSTPPRATTSPYRFFRPATWTAAAAAPGYPAAAGCTGPGTVIIRLVVPRFSRDPQCNPCPVMVTVRNGRSAGELAGQALDAVDETGQEAVGLAGRDVGDAGHQLAQHDGELPAGQVRAQAVVRSRCAEADVRVRRAGDVEAVGIAEHGLVAVGRVIEQHRLVALAVVMPVHGVVPCQGPPHEQDGRGVTDDLLDRGFEPALQVGEEQGPLLRVLGEQHQPVRERVAGGLVARHHQEDEEGGEFGGGELLPVDVRGHQGG